MSFEELPKVLKNLVCEFAFATSWRQTRKSLEMCEKVANYGFSPLFLRRQMWSWACGTFFPSPLVVFRPISRLTGRWSDMIDWHAVNELLYRLDYRRKVVRMGGTRHQWFEKFRADWLNVRQFDQFYRVILHSTIPCFKPTYERQRFNSLGEMNSPFWSARWLLDDSRHWST